MHDARVFFYAADGKWYGICTCGWQTAAFDTSAGAIAACMTHEDSQYN